jgi:HD-GYP domain-containing protein (c-di-GMP phosphodiesterase class II)
MSQTTNQPNNEHFIKAVTELGDTRRIVASRDIYSDSGMKLVASGVRINSELYERLVKHKLLPVLEMAVTMENALDSKAILSDIRELTSKNERLQAMMDRISETIPYERILLGIDLPPALAFKLTVTREKYRRLYDHSLVLTVLSVYLASCDRMNPQEEGWVATAALLHDIGLLHIAPEMLEPTHKMNDEERRHLYAHPLTAYLLLCEFPELNRHIAEAVLEHHEKMDGRGYPRGLHGDKITRYGQILEVAELAAKAFDPDHPVDQWKKLEVMLKLNAKQYGTGLIGHLNILRDKTAGDSPTMELDPELLIAKVRMIATLFADFDQYADPAYSDRIIAFATKRMVSLRLDLLSAGFDPRDPDSLIQLMTDDPDCLPDYAPILHEAVWQLRSLISEVARLWPEDIEVCAQQQEASMGCKWIGDLRLKLYAVIQDD